MWYICLVGCSLVDSIVHTGGCIVVWRQMMTIVDGVDMHIQLGICITHLQLQCTLFILTGTRLVLFL